MKTSSAALCISLLQLIIGLTLLGIYEAYKVSYMNGGPINSSGLDTKENNTATLMSPRSERLVSTPLDWLFYLSIFNNIFCLFFAFAGMLNSFKEFVLWFFIFNAAEVVLAFHFFIDVWTDNRVGTWSRGDLGGYERAATAFVFFNFLLAFIAMIIGVRSLQEIKHKAREEYHRLSVISENLQFEPDSDKM